MITTIVVAPPTPGTQLAPPSNLHKLFETAISNRLKYPTVTLADEHYGPVVVKLAGDRSKYRGDCWVMDEGKFPNTTIFGRITRNGNYLRYMDGRNEQLQKLHAMIEQLIVEPVKTVIENAASSGYCCFCGHQLSDARSTDRGYGPVCAKSYALPWEATKTIEVLNLEEKAVG